MLIPTARCAHKVDVALKYFPAGAQAPAPEVFGEARQREDEAHFLARG